MRLEDNHAVDNPVVNIIPGPPLTNPCASHSEDDVAIRYELRLVSIYSEQVFGVAVLEGFSIYVSDVEHSTYWFLPVHGFLEHLVLVNFFQATCMFHKYSQDLSIFEIG